MKEKHSFTIGGVEIYIELSLKNLAIGPRFKIWTLSDRTGHCPIRPDFVESGVSMKDFKLGGSLERCRTLSG
jgi:hypothetical protein